MEVRQRRERGCGLFLSCENQIFLKLPQQWLAEKAATAMTGRGHSHLHTQFNPSQSSWHHINQAFISMDPKKLYFHSPTPNWGKAKPLPANSRDREAPEQTGVAPPTALTHRHNPRQAVRSVRLHTHKLGNSSSQRRFNSTGETTCFSHVSASLK